MTLRIARFLAILAVVCAAALPAAAESASDTLLWRAPVSGGRASSADWGGFKLWAQGEGFSVGRRSAGYGGQGGAEGRAARAGRGGRAPATTNNRMELAALIAAYELLPADAAVTVYSDSQLCVKTVNEWAAGWERRGWRRKGGSIANLEQV